MKSMKYAALESRAYDNAPVIKYFVQPPIFHVRTYVRMYSDLSNPACVIA